MSRAEDLYRSLGRKFGWSIERCEEIVDEYSRDEYRDDLPDDEEQDDGGS